MAEATGADSRSESGLGLWAQLTPFRWKSCAPDYPVWLDLDGSALMTHHQLVAPRRAACARIGLRANGFAGFASTAANLPAWRQALHHVQPTGNRSNLYPPIAWEKAARKNSARCRLSARTAVPLRESHIPGTPMQKQASLPSVHFTHQKRISVV